MRKNFIHNRLIILLIFGFFLILLTNPNNLPISLLVVPFLYVYILLYQITFLVGSKMFDMKLAPARVVAFSLSSIVVFLLVMRSLINLSVLDVVIATMIVVFLIWYVRRLYAN